MTNEHDKVVKQANPGTPVVITGLSEVPVAGDHFIAYHFDKEAKDAAAIIKQRNTAIASEEQQLNFDPQNDDSHVFVVIKADTQGSAEAVKEALSEINIDKVKLHIIRSATGEVNENDIQLAINTDAFVICFNTNVNSIASDLAKSKDITIKKYSVIYNVLDDVTELMKQQLKPVYEDVVYGRAEVIQLFKASKIGQIAG